MPKQKDGKHKEKKLKIPRETEADRQQELKEKQKTEYQEAIQIEKEAYENLSDPDLLLNILKELDKDHVGDEKPKLFLFASACSSRLPPRHRICTAITGEQAEGKDNLWKTIYHHLPNGWFLDLTRATTASLEDDIKEYNGLYVGEGNFEGGANAPIRDTIKQLAEDGISVLKKDKKTDRNKTLREITNGSH